MNFSTITSFGLGLHPENPTAVYTLAPFTFHNAEGQTCYLAIYEVLIFSRTKDMALFKLLRKCNTTNKGYSESIRPRSKVNTCRFEQTAFKELEIVTSYLRDSINVSSS